MAWALFDERLAPLAPVGTAICVAGVFLVNWRTGVFAERHHAPNKPGEEMA